MIWSTQNFSSIRGSSGKEPQNFTPVSEIVNPHGSQWNYGPFDPTPIQAFPQFVAGVAAEGLIPA